MSSEDVSREYVLENSLLLWNRESRDNLGSEVNEVVDNAEEGMESDMVSMHQRSNRPRRGWLD